jgi:hypothetical protein
MSLPSRYLRLDRPRSSGWLAPVLLPMSTARLVTGSRANFGSFHNRYRGTIAERLGSPFAFAEATDQLRDGSFDITLAVVFENDFFQNVRLIRDPCC